MRKTLALLAGAALLAPGTVLAATPAAASHGYTITDCWKTVGADTVRIRIRDEGKTGRVRVSHRHGKTIFKDRTVKRVFVGVKRTGAGASLTPYGNRPSFRTGTLDGTKVLATFRLRGGKRINMVCTMR